jgi:hypothetical protein
MNPAVFFLLFAAAAVALVAIRLDADRTERGRKRVRAAYSQDAPIWLRQVTPLTPLWAPAAGLFSLPFILPMPLALVPLIPALALIQAAFLLSYRVPAYFVPGWLQDEIAHGVTDSARPDRADWLLFWIVLPVALIADLALTIMLVGFRPR